MLESLQSLVRKGGLFAKSSLFCGNLYEMRQFQCHGKPAHFKLAAYRASPTQFRPKTNVQNFALQNTLYPSPTRPLVGRLHGALSLKLQPHPFQISTKSASWYLMPNIVKPGFKKGDRMWSSAFSCLGSTRLTGRTSVK